VKIDRLLASWPHGTAATSLCSVISVICFVQTFSEKNIQLVLFNGRRSSSVRLPFYAPSVLFLLFMYPGERDLKRKKRSD